MKRRFSKLPIASIAVVVGSLLIGLSMSPVGAQSALTNGSVTVRSDGAVYLIANGVRRWVATVVISDEELNAYPEAEPIYAGLAPIGSAGAGTASTGTTTTKTGATTATTKTGSTTASKTGSGNSTITSKTGSTAATKTGSGNSTIASKTTGSTGTSTEEDVVEEGDVVINPTSGADQKDPNDPTLAAVTTSVDPSAKAEPTGATTCPDSHQIKGGFDKYYWDTDRPDYATVEPEACFVSGAYARAFGYTEVKKRTSSSSTSKPTATATPKPR